MEATQFLVMERVADMEVLYKGNYHKKLNFCSALTFNKTEISSLLWIRITSKSKSR